MLRNKSVALRIISFAAACSTTLRTHTPGMQFLLQEAKYQWEFEVLHFNYMGCKYGIPQID